MLPSTAITRLDLSATFFEFDLAMSRKGFIGSRVLRPFLSGVQSANAGKIPLEALLQTHDTSRAPGAGYSRGDFEFTKYSFATDEHGWEEPMDERQLKLFADMFDCEAVHAQRAVDFVMRNYEIAVAAMIYNTTTWTGAAKTTAITHEWDDASNAVPLTNIEAAKRKVRAGCGLDANALICNRDQFWNLANTNQIVSRIKYWGGDDPKKINEAMIAAACDLEHIIVAGGIKNTANEAQTASISAIWSDEYAMLCRVAETDDPAEPCVGRTFMWSEENAGAPGDDGEIAVIVEEYREEKVRGSVIRARNDRDLVIMYAEAAHLLSNVTTI